MTRIAIIAKNGSGSDSTASASSIASSSIFLGIIYMSPSLTFSPLASLAVPGASRLSSLAWACKSKPRQRVCPVRVGFSCGKLLVREPLSADRSDETVQPLERVILDVAFVQPPRELVRIASCVLGADVVIDAIHAAFQDCPHAFNAVRAGRAPRILSRRMVHRVMVKK